MSSYEARLQSYFDDALLNNGYTRCDYQFQPQTFADTNLRNAEVKIIYAPASSLIAEMQMSGQTDTRDLSNMRWHLRVSGGKYEHFKTLPDVFARIRAYLSDIYTTDSDGKLQFDLERFHKYEATWLHNPRAKW